MAPGDDLDLSKKRRSRAELENLAHWSIPEGKRLQDYWCEQNMLPEANAA